jgi:hypothetical protein
VFEIKEEEKEEEDEEEEKEKNKKYLMLTKFEEFNSPSNISIKYHN